MRLKVYFSFRTSLIVFCIFIGQTTFADYSDEIKIEQPDRILSYKELIPFRLSLFDSKNGKINDVLIKRQKSNRGFNSLIDSELEQSRGRQTIPNAKEVIKGLWEILERRAHELGVKPGEFNPAFKPLTHFDIKRPEHVYDDGNFESNGYLKDRNYVQSYLMDKMGMGAFTAFETYYVMQYGYTQSGLKGAKVAFKNSFIYNLDRLVYGIANNAIRLIETKEKEALLAFGDTDKETIELSGVESFANKLVDDFFNGSESDFSAHFAQIIKTSGVDHTNKQAVKKILIQRLSPLLKSENPIISSILGGRETATYEGIMHEKKTGEGHANGPKTIQVEINNSFFELIRLQIYMGKDFQEAFAFANFIATEYRHVDSYRTKYQENGYNGIYEWLVSDFKKVDKSLYSTLKSTSSRTNKCMALLK